MDALHGWIGCMHAGMGGSGAWHAGLHGHWGCISRCRDTMQRHAAPKVQWLVHDSSSCSPKSASRGRAGLVFPLNGHLPGHPQPSIRATPHSLCRRHHTPTHTSNCSSFVAVNFVHLHIPTLHVWSHNCTLQLLSLAPFAVIAACADPYLPRQAAAPRVRHLV